MTQKHSLKLEDYQRLAEFRYQIRRFVRFSEDAARQAGLEPQQYQLLLAAKGMPNAEPATIGDLAERLQIQHHSTVELVNRLEDNGLVERRRGVADRRQVFVHVTEHGDSTLRDLASHHLTELRALGPELVRVLNEVIEEPIDIERPTTTDG